MASIRSEVSSPQEFTIDEAIAEIGIGRYHHKRYVWLGGVAFSIAVSLYVAFIMMIKYVCMANEHMFWGFWIMSLVFVGFVSGSCVAGILCDKVGRQPVLISGVWLMAVNTILMAVTMDTIFSLYPWHVLLGFGIGLTEFTYVIVIAEFSTQTLRSLGIILSGVFYGIGGVFASIVTYLTINSQGWRFTILTCSVPILVVAVGVTTIPETPKYYCASNQPHRTVKLLQEIASENGTALPRGRLVATHIQDRGNVTEIFSSTHRKNTLLLMLLFFLTGFVYYSVWGMLPFVLQSGYCGLPSRNPKTICRFSGMVLMETIIITSSQLAFLPLVAFVANVFGRLAAQRGVATTMFLSALGANFCYRPVLFTATLFLLRGSSQSLGNILVLYTPEVYPTHIRAVSCGFVMAFSVVGGLVSSTIVWSVGYNISWELMFISITVCSAIGLFVTCLLDLETSRIDLLDGRDNLLDRRDNHESPSTSSHIFSNKNY